MTLQRDDFNEFFAELHGSAKPFAWQRRLLDAVVDGDGWPEALVAPTGSGKTAVIDIHVFALALAVANDSPLPPRRLAMIVGRRVLVDDQHEHARDAAERLARPGDSPVLAEVAKLLWRLQGTPSEKSTAESPLLVAKLRGGVPSSRRWVDHPTAAAVLCATPDMWGSRLLFRGYGSGRLARPREAGLLAVDSVAVVDEAHLARQLLCTARRVHRLVPVADRKWQGPAELRVVETTATPRNATGGVSVEEADLDESALLKDRMCRPKPVTLVPNKDWPAGKHARVDQELARRTVELLDTSGGGTVGCFVNTVARAVAVSAMLRDKRVAGRDLRVLMLCGQVRPIDIERLKDRYPGLLTTDGNPNVDVIVATQTLEVGVDIDLAGIVTELASGSALAQRAGRVNRRGQRETGPVVVLVPDRKIRADARSGPYDTEELTAALEWLERRAADPRGLAPWALRGEKPPVASPRRTLLQRPELGQVWQWARTSDDLAADPNVDLWLSDDLEPDFTVGIVVRGDLPADVTEAAKLINLVPPREYEVFGLPSRTARRALTAARRAADERENSAAIPVPNPRDAILVRGDDTGPLEWTETNGELRPQIRSGDIVVLDAAIPLFTAPGNGDQWTPQVVAADGDDESTGEEEVRLHPADDVLEATALLPGGPKPGEVVHRIDLTREPVLAGLLTPTDDPETEPLDEPEIVRAWLHGHADVPMAGFAVDLLDAERKLLEAAKSKGATRKSKVDVVVQRDADQVPLRVVIIDGRRATADEYIRQEWTPSNRLVKLSDHQAAVAKRVGELAELLKLDDELTAVLREAAQHHDDGKADPRFQVRLGTSVPPLLAKSRGTVTPQLLHRRQDRSGLPPSWRHEQRSVVEAWRAIPAELDRDLVARLIGTSHGHGRVLFPHPSAALLREGDGPEVREIAAALFDRGDWDELIERTEQRYGVWVCAYLEAILRAADGQASGEGR